MNALALLPALFSLWPLFQVEVFRPQYQDAGELREVLLEVLAPAAEHGVYGISVDGDTNELLVLGTPLGLQKIQRLLLQGGPEPAAGPPVQVFHLQHADCRQVAFVLNGLNAHGGRFWGMRITPDGPTNALIVQAPVVDLVNLECLIALLDRPGFHDKRLVEKRHGG